MCFQKICLLVAFDFVIHSFASGLNDVRADDGAATASQLVNTQDLLCQPMSMLACNDRDPAFGRDLPALGRFHAQEGSSPSVFARNMAPSLGEQTLSSPSNSSRPLAFQIAADMQGQHEGIAHGFPLNYEGARGPLVSAGNHPPSNWKAITAWGALYIGAEGSTALNTRVEIRNMQLYILQKSSGKWLQVQKTSDPDGSAYREDYSGNVNKAPDLRRELNGDISVTAGTGAWEGYNFHFYPRDRASIDPKNVGGVLSIVEARLIVADPSKPDDRSAARFLLGCGADYWPDLTSGMPPGQAYEPAVAGGKMKYVRTLWRSFAMTTLSEEQLIAKPPPVDLTGILP